jgi:glycine cleavage system H protein
MNVPKELKYTKTHEWIRFEKGVATVGVTDFAQHQLSELTYVELPETDEAVSAHDEVAVVESVKAASDVYAPFDGVIVEVNEALNDQVDLINNDPYGEGWIFKIKPEKPFDVDLLLDADQYEELLPESED